VGHFIGVVDAENGFERGGGINGNDDLLESTSRIQILLEFVIFPI
jgi:hypothetical protein